MQQLKKCERRPTPQVSNEICQQLKKCDEKAHTPGVECKLLYSCGKTHL